MSTAIDPLNPETEIFRVLCKHLDNAIRRRNATCSVDVFSGGFKFSDEIPADYEQLGDQLPPLVDLLRCLWGYRASVVVGKPRQDLATYWEAVLQHAPHWAGFSAKRSSKQMKAHVDKAGRRTEAVIREMDRLDRSLAKAPTLA